MYKSILFVLLIAIPACGDSVSEAYYVWIINSVTAGGNVTPDNPDNPISDKCENCNGTGTLGDGRTKVECPVCEGTGRSVQSTQAKADDWPPRSLVLDSDGSNNGGMVHSTLPNGAVVGPVLERPVKKKQTIRRSDGSTYQRIVTAQRDVVVDPGKGIGSWPQSVYYVLGRSRYTWPGNLRTHLATTHGIDRIWCQHATRKQLTDLHDLIHGDE